MAEHDSIVIPPRVKDLTGKAFGRLTVIRYYGVKPTRWLCQCECGEQCVTQSGHLIQKHSTSCGCFRTIASASSHTVHGMSDSTEYRIWVDMRRRCTDSTRPGFKSYGGRGIAVCERWGNSFAAFYEDMGPRPSSAYSVERKNNNLGYSPDNCKWATSHEQLRNTRRNRRLTLNGITMCVTDWATQTGMSSKTIYKRLTIGWSIEDALTIHVGCRHSNGPIHLD